MKILVISHSSNISGGANRSLLSVIDGLIEKHGVDVSVLVMSNQGAFIDALREKNVHILIFPYHSICSRLDGGIRDWLRYIKIYILFFLDWINASFYYKKLRQYNFDLVYTNTRLIYFGGFLAKKLGLPHIWHIREYGKENGGYSVLFANKAIEKLSSKVIFISNDLKSTFNEYAGINGVCIYNGIPKREPIKKIQHEGINILLTGRLVKEKGQLQAIEAINGLSEKTKKCVRLFLAGSGNVKSSYVKYLHDYVNRFNLPVEFCGEVTDMDNLRSRIDIELMCAEREAFGRVTIEALQCGIPVIGANTGATPEIIRDGVNGLLYEKKDTHALSECIEKLVKDKDCLSLMSKKAVEVDKDKYDIDRCVENIYNLFVLEVRK